MIESFQETLLVVPLHVLMSVGLVVEEGVNYLPLRIGEVDPSGDIFDLALLYTQTKVSGGFRTSNRTAKIRSSFFSLEHPPAFFFLSAFRSLTDERAGMAGVKAK